MSVDTIAVLTELGIPFKERGHNISRNYVGLRCPWCGDDPSEHLGIHKQNGGYNCWRDSRHAGRNIYYVLREFKIPHDRIVATLNHYENSTPEEERAERPPFSGWEQLEPATQDCHLSYLYSRGFTDPLTAVRIGDLRCSDVGNARWRLLFPMFSDSGNEGWTGRSYHKLCTPRYFTECDRAEACWVGRIDAPRLLVLEGPVDALKANVAAQMAGLNGFAAGAYHGKGLTKPQLRMLLRRKPTKVMFASDNDDDGSWYRPQFRSQIYPGFDELQVFTTTVPLIIPKEYKDIGEIPVNVLSEWLREKVDAKSEDRL